MVFYVKLARVARTTCHILFIEWLSVLARTSLSHTFCEIKSSKLSVLVVTEITPVLLGCASHRRSQQLFRYSHVRVCDIFELTLTIGSCSFHTDIIFTSIIFPI